jgi:hypothetical protein
MSKFSKTLFGKYSPIGNYTIYIVLLCLTVALVVTAWYLISVISILVTIISAVFATILTNTFVAPVFVLVVPSLLSLLLSCHCHITSVVIAITLSPPSL